MKKFLFLILTTVLFVSCAGDISSDDPDKKQQEVSIPATEVKLMAKSRGFSGNRLNEDEDENIVEMQTSTKNTATAYFYLRVDNRIPDCGSYDGKYYFPMTAMYKSVFADNEGTIDLDYVYKNANGTSNIYEYVYSTDGSATAGAIVDEPSLEKILGANRNYMYDVAQIPTDTLKALWYIVKHEQDIWHVDGVLTGMHTKSVVDIPNIIINEKDICEDTIINPEPIFYPGEVEVDIHQQTHTDWKSIKTSIHVRDTVDVEVVIPIDSCYMSKADDFAIRTYESYYKTYKDPVKLQIIHSADSIIINITGVTAEILKDLRTEGDDGLTFEITSYIKDEDNEQVWEQIKQSTVSTLNKTTIKGQITSALYPEEKKVISYTKEDFEKK